MYKFLRMLKKINFKNTLNLFLLEVKKIFNKNNFTKENIEKKLEYLEIKKISLSKVIIIVLITLFLSLIINIGFISQIDYWKNLYMYSSHNVKKLNKKINIDNIDNKIQITRIEEKVNNLSVIIKKLYPSFDYNKTIQDSYNNTNLIDSIPEGLDQLYVQTSWIDSHGINKYQKTLKNIIFPLEEKDSFITSKYSEFGQSNGFVGKHTGVDSINYYNNSVYAIYDCVVYNKFFDKLGGFTLGLNFEYINEDGTKDYYFYRLEHLDKIYVNVGQKIKKGDIIANCGETGINVTGKHLHFELWKWDKIKRQMMININPFQNSTWGNKIIDSL